MAMHRFSRSMTLYASAAVLAVAGLTGLQFAQNQPVPAPTAGNQPNRFTPGGAGDQAEPNAQNNRNNPQNRQNAGQPLQPADGQNQNQANQANQPNAQGQSERTTMTLAYPTGQRETSTILVEKSLPKQVRVGELYKYEIKVTNLTKQPLSGVTVVETLGDGIELEASTPAFVMEQGGQQHQGMQNRNQQNRNQLNQNTPENQGVRGLQGQQGDQPAANNPAANQQNQNRQGMAQGNQPGQNQANQADGQNQPGANIRVGAVAIDKGENFDTARWVIGELQPNQTRTINVTAVAHEVGAQGDCLAVSYNPTLCSVVNVINPQITLSKEGPQAQYLCDQITYNYTVKNTGTGTAEGIVIQETLPDGLTTADGKQVLALDVGNLEAGQSKTVKAQVKAERPGEYASRAVAISEGDSAFSRKVTTTVYEPKLAVDVVGPEWQYLNQPVTYTIRVQNISEAPARDTVLMLDAPGLNDQNKQRQIGVLDPGQTREVTVTVPGLGKKEALQFQARAQAYCAVGEDAAARDVEQTAFRGLPALLIDAIDLKDPVAVGDTTTYRIRVKNQGSEAASNINLTGSLPEGAAFVEGRGPTDVKMSGGQLAFGTVDSLAPGDSATWNVVVKANNPGDGRFRVAMESDYLDTPVVSMEPTRLIGSGEGVTRD